MEKIKFLPDEDHTAIRMMARSILKDVLYPVSYKSLRNKSFTINKTPAMGPTEIMDLDKID